MTKAASKPRGKAPDRARQAEDVIRRARELGLKLEVKTADWVVLSPLENVPFGLAYDLMACQTEVAERLSEA